MSDPVRDETPFASLTPEVILDAVERFDVRCDGRFLALNSYENRVFRVGVEDAAALVAKFYRPGRWSDDQIREEHSFADEMAALEIPVAAPIKSANGDSVVAHKGFRVALFPMLAGEWPDLDRPGRLRWLGRFLGRIHALGRVRGFEHRPSLDVSELGYGASRFLIEHAFIPQELTQEYAELSDELLAMIESRLEAVPTFQLRLHGDCHPGNVLWSEMGPAFVDLDDSRMGPAVQDLWMLLSGEPDEQRAQLEELLAGYQLFTEFDRREIALIEALRTLRQIYYAGWIGRRWHDPAFPRAFPWFESPSYWRGHVEDLRAQRVALGAEGQ